MWMAMLEMGMTMISIFSSTMAMTMGFTATPTMAMTMVCNRNNPRYKYIFSNKDNNN